MVLIKTGFMWPANMDLPIIVSNVESGFIRENNIYPLSYCPSPVIEAPGKFCCFWEV
jgi:hypothetical protein